MDGRKNRTVREVALAMSVFAMLLFSPQLILAQDTGEHPEHPEEGEKAEHPEHPEDGEHAEHPEDGEHAEHSEHPEDEASMEMTLDELAVAITGYIEQDSKLKGGYFLIYDTVDKKMLQLELVKVHEGKLAALGEGVYFACTDMKAADDTIYDLDFFMKGTRHGIETTAVSVHKKSGVARYFWKEVDGAWTQVENDPN